MVNVQSSQIAAVGHDPATNVLTVRFHSGATYEYSGVPASVHSSIMSAPSVGKAFNEQVKNGGYSHRKV